MKFKNLIGVISSDSYIEVVVMNGFTGKEVDGFGFYGSDYEGEICDKLDFLDVHCVKSNEFRGLDVVLLESDK